MYVSDGSEFGNVAEEREFVSCLSDTAIGEDGVEDLVVGVGLEVGGYVGRGLVWFT